MWLWVTTWNLDCGTVRCNSPAVQCPFFTYVFLSVCLFYKGYFFCFSSMFPTQISVAPRSSRSFGPSSTKRRRKLKTWMKKFTTWPRCPCPRVHSSHFIHTTGLTCTCFISGGLRQRLVKTATIKEKNPVFTTLSWLTLLILHHHYRCCKVLIFSAHSV